MLLFHDIFKNFSVAMLHIRVNGQGGAGGHSGRIVAVGDHAGSSLQVGQVVGGDSGVAHLVQLSISGTANTLARLKLSK